ncbi:hypothetical protein MMC06_001265 [Schaereria dolodes]|nr:hypothetical protein [Schaereria dolodes]
MLPRISPLVVSIWALASTTWAQTSSVPTDLSSGFELDAIQLTVSYGGSTITDGEKLSSQETSKEPLFSLGDASGVNTVISFLIVMVDTTTKNRVCHFIQTDFKADGDETGIASTTQPLVSYQAPGTLGESGDSQYSFLLYEQTAEFQAKNLPQSGQTFDVESFQSANGLKSAIAGLAMKVDLTAASTSSGQQTSAALSTSSTNVQPSQSTESDSSVTPQGAADASSSAVVISTNPAGSEIVPSITGTSFLSSMSQSTASSPETSSPSTIANATPAGQAGISSTSGHSAAVTPKTSDASQLLRELQKTCIAVLLVALWAQSP